MSEENKLLFVFEDHFCPPLHCIAYFFLQLLRLASDLKALRFPLVEKHVGRGPTHLTERDLFHSRVGSVKPSVSTFASQWTAPVGDIMARVDPTHVHHDCSQLVLLEALLGGQRGGSTTSTKATSKC